MPRRKLKLVPRGTFAARKIQRAFRARRGRTLRMKRRVPLARKQHTFVERAVEEYALAVNGGSVNKTFQLDDIYNKVSYQKLFEYYKINKVVVEFRYKSDGNPRRDVTQANQMGVNEANPVLWFKVDHNDVTSQTLDQLKASSRTKERQFTNNRPNFSIVIRPATLSESYKSTVASTYIPKWSQWLTTGDLTVPHYGLKCIATGPAAAQYGQIIMTTKYYFTMKNNE